MSRNKKFFCLVLIIFAIVSICSYSFIKNRYNIGRNVVYSNTDTLINISELSEKFMNDYFKEISEIKEDDKDNILIVTSKEKLKKTYGAKKVIEAPNNQYFIQYNSKEEMDKAHEQFTINNPSIKIDNNIKYEISDDSVVAYSYNSWGVEAMGIDSLLEKLEDKELNDVTVAIIDTGLNVDLFNQNYPGRLAGYYSVLNPEDPMTDTNGHGTHIAGTIAENTPNNVKILPIKVSQTKSMYTTDILTGINYITYGKKADVANMSFGSSYYSASLYQAIDSANNENITCVAAAGNDNTSEKSYPAASNNTISVAAVDSNKQKAEFSNYGDTIMFAAPGVDILSINGKMSGTSMATPHVVSSAAILKSLNNNITLKDVVSILRRYAEDLGDPGWDNYYGYGFINFTDTNVCDGTDCDEYNIPRTMSAT